MELVSKSPEETIRIGRRIGEKAEPGAVIALEGALGSGKTTLVKGIAGALQIEEQVTSPTFTIISQYRGLKEGCPVELYHIDLYRIRQAPELEQLGLEEILDGQGISVIEWSEKAEGILPEDCVHVRMLLTAEGERIIRIRGLAL